MKCNNGLIQWKLKVLVMNNKIWKPFFDLFKHVDGVARSNVHAIMNFSLDGLLTSYALLIVGLPQ